ncbi:hypothetical protein [Tanticharoenia sakaeratensis]|jgi:ElaB/YqjD/DUF883 family membrane-anchored ribosome-binding protein|uniref:DUF883 domain-containing protein n=1 Tax=Tanticharoenia sakaeratensis NBRC 103193 TaxID=1231623 RepID=A0A0D6MGV8_9PROT|nr:hypothetical protein [Tanticharoenia sakaeratensis]GAN52869.1 hypothetical protein Tasa_003_047 [Tanticharoenia sakaeratensis NBRC 103193]GBQ18329.1 hypothetical protein AA103193_0651 [Tanticharoenia sakaeratensis NBRC 103193]
MGRGTVKDATTAAADSTQAQIDSLRDQVQRLLTETISPALIDAADRADHAVANARQITDHQVDNVSTRVRAQPILAILISSVVGFLAGRFSK